MPFENVTRTSGIRYKGQTWSAAWGDVNNDGRLDLWISTHNPHAFIPDAQGGILYLNNADGTFTDVSALQVEYLQRDMHGSQWADFDNDGDKDLAVAHSTERGEAVTLFENTGGRLLDVAPEIGFNVLPVSLLGRNLMWLDFDRDGLLDLYYGAERIPFPQADTVIFRQTPDGIFVNANTQVGLIASSGTPLLGDLSGDGAQELILTRYGRIGEIIDTSGPQWQNIQGTWLSDIDIPVFDNMVIADFNNDGKNDLFIARSGVQDEVTLRGDQQIRSYFTDTGDQKSFSFVTGGTLTVQFPKPDGAINLNLVHVGAAGRDPFASDLAFEFQLSADNPDDHGLASPTTAGVYIGYNPGLDVWDYVVAPRDVSYTGFPSRGVVINSTAPITDLQVQGVSPPRPAAPSQLLINNGSRFVDESVATGIADMRIYGNNCAAGDFDNDGDVDIYVDQATAALNRPNLLLVNQGDGTFLRSLADGATGTQRGTGGAIAVADYDQDGFLDLALLNGGANPPFNALQDGPAQLFRNIPNGNHWLQVRLHGTDASEDAIGAKVFVTAGGQQQFREMLNGQHIRAQDSPLLHFGVGENTSIDRLEVLWPNGVSTTVLTDLPVDEIIDIRQAEMPAARPGRLSFLSAPAEETGVAFDGHAAAGEWLIG